jgi:hypothetical protein
VEIVTDKLFSTKPHTADDSKEAVQQEELSVYIGTVRCTTGFGLEAFTQGGGYIKHFMLTAIFLICTVTTNTTNLGLCSNLLTKLNGLMNKNHPVQVIL